MSDSTSHIEQVNQNLFNGTIQSSITNNYGHGCGGFMSNVFLKTNKLGSYAIIYIPQNRNVSLVKKEEETELYEWWIAFIAEHYGIKAHYLGMETNKHLNRRCHVVIYEPEESHSPQHRLLRYTVLRYMWITPYAEVVIMLRNFLKEFPDVGVDKSILFSILCAQLSYQAAYSTTYALYAQGGQAIFTTENFNAMLRNELTVSMLSVHNLTERAKDQKITNIYREAANNTTTLVRNTGSTLTLISQKAPLYEVLHKVIEKLHEEIQI